MWKSSETTDNVSCSWRGVPFCRGRFQPPALVTLIPGTRGRERGENEMGLNLMISVIFMKREIKLVNNKEKERKTERNTNTTLTLRCLVSNMQRIKSVQSYYLPCLNSQVHTFGFPSWMAFAGIQHGLFLLDLCEREAWGETQKYEAS